RRSRSCSDGPAHRTDCVRSVRCCGQHSPLLRKVSNVGWKVWKSTAMCEFSASDGCVVPIDQCRLWLVPAAIPSRGQMREALYGSETIEVIGNIGEDVLWMVVAGSSSEAAVVEAWYPVLASAGWQVCNVA